MQESIIEKRIDERVIEKFKQSSTTIFSNNPFDSTRKLNLKKDDFSLDEAVYTDEIINKKELDIDGLRIEFSLKDFRTDEKNPFLANNVGQAYLSIKNFEKAKEYFELSLELDPNFRTAKLNLANLYKQIGNFDKSIKIYESLISINTKDKGVLVNLGNIYLITSQLAKAEKYFNILWEESKNDLDVGNKLAIINLIKGDFKKSISILRNCLTITPNNAAIYNTLGVAFSFEKLYKKSTQAFKTSLNLSPSYTAALLNLSEVLIRNNDVKSILEITESFCEKFDDTSALDLLAVLYLISGNYNRSLIILNKLYRKSVESKSAPNEISRLLNNIGVAYHRIEEYKKAETFYLEALDIDDNNKIALINLIDAYFSINDLDKVRKNIDSLKEKYPSDNSYLYYDAIYFKEKGNIEEAVKCLLSLIERDKKSNATYGLLSYIYSEIRLDYKKSIEVLEEAFEYLQDDIVIINDLAYNYLMNNEIDKAKLILKNVNNINNNIFLTATQGLLAIKENNIDLGRYLYNTSINRANNSVLKSQIEQKKNIELAKYYHKFGSNSLAIDLLKKVLKPKPTVYTRQAKLLLEEFNHQD